MYCTVKVTYLNLRAIRWLPEVLVLLAWPLLVCGGVVGVGLFCHWWELVAVTIVGLSGNHPNLKPGRQVVSATWPPALLCLLSECLLHASGDWLPSHLLPPPHHLPPFFGACSFC